MSEVAFFVFGTPKGKGRPRFSRKSGRAYTPAQTAAYESTVAYAGHTAMQGKSLLEGPVGVKMTAVFGIPASWSKKRQAEALHHTSKPDADNIAKCCDALNGIVWKDDAQIARISISKVYGEVPGLHVFVEALA
ncbi:MAG: RusA family crossover junction endodeoxyribonuclease [Betaproteobacteria bacterium]|nr:RusA family crossover junction endodeoxyribonuclease [Betaproteobacteria bacterium]